MDKIKNLTDTKNYEIDISFIMQSFIDESRYWKNSLSFIKSVKSFENMQDERSELIIVSDGCKKTEEAYFNNFSLNKNIKYIFLDKKSNHINGLDKKRFRGLPREVGRSISSGYVTAYLDSDDRLMSNASKIIRNAWNNPGVNSNIEALFQTDCYRNTSELVGGGLCDPKMWKSIGDTIKIDDLFGDWSAMRLKGNKRSGSTWTITHLSSCDSKWKDTNDIHEDHLFCKSLMKDKNYLYFGDPYYIIINEKSLQET
tara:strand:- start:172 stop:939 length:768 start_codon:yes stop_codon:yes gene_type:complete